MFQKIIYPVIFSSAALMTLLTACGDGKSAAAQAAAGPSAAPALPVDVIVAQEQDIAQHEVITGTTVPFREVTIKSEVAERVLQVGFQDGALVTAGQVLYKLNDADLQARLKQLTAELKMAQLTERRLAALLKTETVRQQEYDEVATRLQVLEAQQEILKAGLAKTLVTAPFSGRIGITKVVAGAYVAPNTELVSLQDQQQVKINFSVPEKYLPLIKTGATVRFTTELGPDEHIATIKATEPGVDAANRSMLVQALANNAGNRLRAGLSARILFSTADAGTKGIAIPTEALLPGGDGYAVYVLKGGTAQITPVSIGNRTESQAIITSGLQNGDSIIVSNTLRLGNGAAAVAVASK
ncbi:efflux RND transporter periplasmic adaptor subunit [Chitinophaga caseinilytica]|uniref:efflux RND transporter periplasmic adaptor subunit n=1 Tax=Chitinophaga caseinilytica TaxID=2267521 RepID=UPI003C2DF15B